jgi:hypothetical protein
MTTAHAITLPVSADASEGAPLPQAGNFVISDTGLRVNGTPSYEQWEAFGLQLADKYNKLKWLISDWLAYGEDTYGDDIYQLASEYWQPQTIANYVTTARRIPQSERRADVVFSIHSETTSLSPDNRKYALNMVASKQWNRDDLRDWKRSLKTGETPMDSEQTITLQCKGFTVKNGILTVAFVAPSETFEIVGYQATVRKRIPAPVVSPSADSLEAVA